MADTFGTTGATRVFDMRSIILAFACGVLLLQQQGQLPGTDVLLVLCGVAVVSLLLAVRYSPRLLFLTVSGFLLGFVWAAWFAQVRLNDRLPETMEGRDVEIVGVIAALPSSFERGERFEFAVESADSADSTIRLPSRIMLSWYHGWHEDEWHECA